MLEKRVEEWNRELREEGPQEGEATLLLDKPPSRLRQPRLPVSKSAGGLAPGFSTLKEAVAAADLAEDRRRAR